MIVPTALLPPFTEAGERVKPVIRTRVGVTVRVAVRVTELPSAVIVPVVFPPMAMVETVTLPLLDPAAINTEAGIKMSGDELEKVTNIPPVGAGAVSETEAVVVSPPSSDDCPRVNVLNAIGRSTVRVADFVMPKLVAVIVTFVFAVTTDVVTVNVLVRVPDAKEVELGTCAAAVLLLANVTSVVALTF